MSRRISISSSLRRIEIEAFLNAEKPGEPARNREAEKRKKSGIVA
jgi:hypothetical protein